MWRPRQIPLRSRLVDGQGHDLLELLVALAPHGVVLYMRVPFKGSLRDL